MVEGYRAYFCKETNSFVAQAFLSTVEDTPSDSTEAWFTTFESAVAACDKWNAKTDVKICKDCGQPFILTPREAEWFTSRDLVPPVRCKSCRIKRKQKLNLATN